MAYRTAYLGCGVGLRTKHFPHVLDGTARVDWFEVISENFMIRGGRPLAVLEKARSLAPIVLHGVSLSLGSTDPLNDAYLRELAALADRFEPAWVSDHLCWSSVGGHYAHDLLPLPYTEEALGHVVERLQRVQDRLRRQILIENVSSYLTFTHSTMPEWQFLAEVARRADCGILLDVNNIYVSATNHGFDSVSYLAEMPVDRVCQIHLAGHSDAGTHLLDTHDAPVCDAVWDLYSAAVQRFGRVSTLVEWDAHVPELEVLLAEAERARVIVEETKVGMFNLRELQQRFHHALERPHGASGDAALDPELLRHICGRGALGPQDRIDVYATMYCGRLLDVLREDFPRVASYLGSDHFHDLGHAYLAQHPSTHPSLRYLGRAFPDFLARAGDAFAPFIPDLARLEWQRIEVFDGADAAPLTLGDLEQVPAGEWGSLSFDLIPACAVLESAWPVHALWAADEEPPRIGWQPAPVWLRVWRRGFAVYQASMDATERAALARVGTGAPFAEVCAALESPRSPEEAAREAAALLLRWIEDGVLAAPATSRKGR